MQLTDRSFGISFIKEKGFSHLRKVLFLKDYDFLFSLQREQPLQDEQLQSQEVLPFFFLIIDVTMTDITILEQAIIKMISSAPIIKLLF